MYARSSAAVRSTGNSSLLLTIPALLSPQILTVTLSLRGDANHGKIVHVGAMDHQPVATEVMKYLEGGPDTYQMKFEKYRAGRPRK